MPGAIELLDKLNSLGIITAVATTTSREKTDQRLKKLGLYDRFKSTYRRRKEDGI